MSINLTELLSEEISDEIAFHLANFMMVLALAVDSHYVVQIRRYCKQYREERQPAPELDVDFDPDSDPF